jgi:hypothetical protein
MVTSNRRGVLVQCLICASLAFAWPWVARGQKEGKKKADEKVALQYRIAADASSPSRFLAVRPSGLTGVLEITWGISNADKRKLDAYLLELERWEFNGVELECWGRWEEGGRLRVVTTPQLTETGRKRIVESIVARLLYGVFGPYSFARPREGVEPTNYPKRQPTDYGSCRLPALRWTAGSML